MLVAFIGQFMSSSPGFVRKTMSSAPHDVPKLLKVDLKAKKTMYYSNSNDEYNTTNEFVCH